MDARASDDPLVRAHLRRLLARSARRAEERRIDFRIVLGDLVAAWAAQGGRCALSDAPLAVPGDPLPARARASLDRIDSSRGYVLDNIQLVRSEVNFAKHVASVREFILLAKRVSASKAARGVEPAPVTSPYFTERSAARARALRERHEALFRAKAPTEPP